MYYTVLYCTVQCTLNSTYCTFVLLVEKNCSGKQLPFLLLLTLIQTTAILKHKIKLHKNSIINIMKLLDMSVLVLLPVKFHLFFKLLLWGEYFRASDSGLKPVSLYWKIESLTVNTLKNSPPFYQQTYMVQPIGYIFFGTTRGGRTMRVVQYKGTLPPHLRASCSITKYIWKDYFFPSLKLLVHRILRAESSWALLWIALTGQAWEIS